MTKQQLERRVTELESRELPDREAARLRQLETFARRMVNAISLPDTAVLAITREAVDELRFLDLAV